MSSIAWDKELARLYSRVIPSRVSQINAMLLSFAGYEEALWMFLCKRYGENPDSLSTKPQITVNQMRGRFIRFLARYNPQRLEEVDKLMLQAAQEGFSAVFEPLVRQYGPEPLNVNLNIRERVQIMYCTYGQLSKSSQITQLLQQNPDDAILMRRLEAELGPEPQISDPGTETFRQRLKRIYRFYDPAHLAKVDTIPDRAEADAVRFFAALQRKYGRQPTEGDLNRLAARQDPRQRKTIIGPESAAVAAEAVTNAAARVALTAEQEQQISQMTAKAQEILEAATSIHLQHTDKSIRRDRSIIRIREHLSGTDPTDKATTLRLTTAVFRFYDKLLTMWAPQLVEERFGDVDESREWLSFLDMLYVNAQGAVDTPSLRTIASLLEMHYGNKVEEIAAAGGVERFLAGVDRDSTDYWIRHLIAAHGEPSEADLALRNRNRAHFLYYNPDKTIAEADRQISKIQQSYPVVEEALCALYGDEPVPPPVDVMRAKKLVDRYAPFRLVDETDLSDVIFAHCFVGDSPDMVLRRLERTYGMELSLVEKDVDLLFKNEMSGRFSVFKSEMRMREILARRYASSFGSTEDLFDVIQQQAAREAALKLESQKMLLRQQHEQLLMTTKAKQQKEQEQRQAERNELFEAETEARAQIENEQQLDHEEMSDIVCAALDIWDEDTNFELKEMLYRHLVMDSEAEQLEPIVNEMHAEREELNSWLIERLKWRKKWAMDDMQRRAEIADFVEELHDEEEVEQRRRESIELVQATFSETRQHQLVMEERYKDLNEQAVKVLQFEAEVLRSREKIRRSARVQSTNVTLSRAIHEGCVFHKKHFDATVNPDERLRQLALIARPESIVFKDRQSFDELFKQQVTSYINSLFQQHEPQSVGTELGLLEQYAGKEADLVLALEQRFNVHYWVEQNLRDRVEVYYSKMAPERMGDETNRVLHRFAGQEAPLWAFLEARYGPNPQLQTNAMRLYLKNRLVRYLATHAPHLMNNADDMVRRCRDNGDELFAELTEQFGPEDADVAKDTLARKLRTFYKVRGIPRPVDNAKVIAQRFVGMEDELNRMLRQKFADDLNRVMPDL